MKCPYCNGTGLDKNKILDAVVNCGACNGTGEIGQTNEEMKYLCGKCIHFDVCYVPRSIGCVEQCEHFKEYTLQAELQPTEDYLPINCYVCNGSGWVAGNAYMHTHKCPRCNGSGKINYKTFTNEDFIKTASAEEFAEWVSDIIYECSDKMVQEDGYGCAVCNLHWCSKQDVLTWLKEKHTE